MAPARNAARRFQRYFRTASVGLWWVDGDRLRLEGLALSDRCEPSVKGRIRGEYGVISRSSDLPGPRAIRERRVLRLGTESSQLQPDVRSVLRAVDADSLVCTPIYVDGDAVGVGLGLATVHDVVRERGGVVTVENWGVPPETGGAAGEGGARFVVRLPVADADRDPGPEELEHANLPGSGPGRLRAGEPGRHGGAPPEVLVVDDDEAVLDSPGKLLDQMGYRPRTAATGEEALELPDSGEDPDVILSDGRMPGMGELGLFRKLSETRPELAERLAFASGDLPSVETRSFLREVDRPVLAKPFGVDDLRAVLEGVLERTGS